MARFWIGLILLCLGVSQVDGRGGRGGRRGHGSGAASNWELELGIYFAALAVVTVVAVIAACLCARETGGAQCILGIPQRPLIWIASTWLCFAPPLGILVWICMFAGWEQE